MKFSIAKAKTTLIDKEDYEKVSKFRWNFNNGAVSTNIKLVNGRRTTLKMHRYILNLPARHPLVDHINGDPLDNRKKNLRICNHAENLRNRGKAKNNKSGYKGVSWAKHANKWQASICTNYKQYHLGLFDDPKEAYRVYKKACKELHQDFAHV